MKKRWPIVAMIACIIIIMIVVLFFFNYRSDKSDSPEYVFFYADNQTADYPSTLGGQKFADLVYERTKGRIKIIVKCDAELGSEAEVINQMKYGGIAFARVSLFTLISKPMPMASTTTRPSSLSAIIPFMYEIIYQSLYSLQRKKCHNNVALNSDFRGTRNHLLLLLRRLRS